MTDLSISGIRDRTSWGWLTATLLIIILLYYPTICAIADICWNDEDYSHGLILPFVTIWLIYSQRQDIISRLSQGQPRLSLCGISLLLFGLIALFIGQIASILFANWVAFFATVVGTLFLTFGFTPSLPLVPPILLLFMAKPMPDSLVPRLFFPLQVLAAKVGAAALTMLDVPVYLMGNIIEIPNMRLMVEEACSGIRSLLALLTVGCIVVLVVKLPTWAKFFVLLISVITAIALNVVRVTATGLLAHFWDPAAASGFFHSFSGMVTFIIGLFIVYGIATFLEIREPKP